VCGLSAMPSLGTSWYWLVFVVFLILILLIAALIFYVSRTPASSSSSSSSSSRSSTGPTGVAGGIGPIGPTGGLPMNYGFSLGPVGAGGAIVGLSTGDGLAIGSGSCDGSGGTIGFQSSGYAAMRTMSYVAPRSGTLQNLWIAIGGAASDAPADLRISIWTASTCGGVFTRSPLSVMFSALPASTTFVCDSDIVNSVAVTAGTQFVLWAESLSSDLIQLNQASAGVELA
jgi:hypothetical protein